MGKIGSTLAAAVAVLAATGTAAHAATVPVQSLTGDFAATNSTVTKTPEGVHFGVYADAGRAGGSLYYSGANGLTLGQIVALGYTYNHSSSDDSPLAAPYLRVFLDSDGDGTEDADVIFDPTLCGTATPAENVDVPVDVTASTVRYNDDPCVNGASQQPFVDVRAAHGSDVVTGIFITQGFSGGADAAAYVRSLTVNGSSFAFNVAPTGSTVTNIVRVPVVVPAARPVGQDVRGQSARSCRGEHVRTIRAPRRTGERFVRVNASLRGRKLASRGRTIKVDLRERGEGNYNVRLISRYRMKSGKVHRVVTRRNLSVACS